MGNLAAETMARCRLVWPDVCRCWLPVWLPIPLAQLTFDKSGPPTDRSAPHSPDPGARPKPTQVASRPDCRPDRLLRMAVQPTIGVASTDGATAPVRRCLAASH